METFLYVLMCLMIFMLGGCLGSFFNVVLLRAPEKQDFVKTRSHCPECKHVLKWFELIPVFSFVFLRGRCRECMTRIKPRYILMELFCGGGCLWVFTALGFDRPNDIAQTLIGFILFPVLVALSAEDIKKTEIPYWCSLSIAALGVIAAVLSFIPAIPTDILWYEHLIGMFVISVPFAVFCYLGAMGGGDVQLVAAAGLLLGWAIVPSVLIAMLTGGVFGIAVKITKKRATICFGPFLALGIAAGYLYGHKIIQVYSSFIG
jgi:leader peptidase (prepilin peptidase)/N-methyltransferase